MCLTGFCKKFAQFLGGRKEGVFFFFLLIKLQPYKLFLGSNNKAGYLPAEALPPGLQVPHVKLGD